MQFPNLFIHRQSPYKMPGTIWQWRCNTDVSDAVPQGCQGGCLSSPLCCTSWPFPCSSFCLECLSPSPPVWLLPPHLNPTVTSLSLKGVSYRYALHCPPNVAESH